VVRNLNVGHSVQRSDQEPRPDEECEAGGVIADSLVAESSQRRAFSQKTGEHGDSEEWHLLLVVGLGIFGALVLLECGIGDLVEQSC